MQLTIGNDALSLTALRQVWSDHIEPVLSPDASRRVADSAAAIESVLASGDQVYGVNTGFGQLAHVRVSASELKQLQENLVRSHACGVGPLLPDAVVRLTLALKVSTLAQGYSGVSEALLTRLCQLLEYNIYPCVPSKGSVGASGDLAPLSHLACALIGVGDVRVEGREVSALEALDRRGLAPLELGPKEGLALLNGTQVSTAIALAAAFRAERVLAASIVAGALAADAIKGSDTPFDDRIHRVRRHAGQRAVAAELRRLMAGSQIRASHVDCQRVQDPYSIRCQPQVAGACLGALQHVVEVLEAEANAVTDNPLVFADGNEVLSGGNFHAEPVALAADYLALAIAEIGALSERRIALLIDANLSGLPAFLVADGGLNSGFMLPQVTAAALASENKSLAHPASVDSIPTSANQEDHVSMATFAASRLHTMLENVAAIVAIELLAAAQGVEFHRPKKSSPPLEAAIDIVRRHSAAYTEDRGLGAEVSALSDTILAGEFCSAVSDLLPSY